MTCPSFGCLNELDEDGYCFACGLPLTPERLGRVTGGLPASVRPLVYGDEEEL